MRQAAASPEMEPWQTEVIQARWIDLLPRFLGYTCLLIVWFALQALAWLTEAIFHTTWFTMIAAIFGLAILPHWISVLLALALPSRRRLVVDENGISYRLGMSVHATNWAEAGSLTMTRSLFGRSVLRASGGLRTRSWFWTILEWPLLLLAWLTMLGIAILLSPPAVAAIDFPWRDSYTIPRIFYRDANLDRLKAVLGSRLTAI
ncbi:MAG: hypothetical protein JNL25_16090 [Rhodospirillaceae bacterium]|nr:hypothetical protein [Rhodospirillaceae bacterium]